uniref:Uncharacterized protein n=1 Tax=Ursus maritimus TaxID=29073 RepID=A0A452URJ7_URSMA
MSTPHTPEEESSLNFSYSNNLLMTRIHLRGPSTATACSSLARSHVASNGRKVSGKRSL